MHCSRPALACIAAALVATTLPALAVDAPLLQAAQAAQPAVIASLKEMVTIESGSANGDGLASMADFTEARLKALGASTERIKATVGPGSLVHGTFTGTGSARIMLIAHMDTVYPLHILATQPWHQDGNKLYGPGIADDKGGIAVILHSLQLLKDAGWKNYAQLDVLFNPDEEVGSSGSGGMISTLADQHDVVMSFEPTAAKAVVKGESLLLGASGIATATMEVHGKQSHAGAAPELGRNALIELSYQLLQTRDVAKSVPGTQLNWTMATGGIVMNQIPEKSVAYGDVRLTVPGAEAALLAALQAKVDSGKLVPDTTVQLRMDLGRPAFVANARGKEMGQHAQTIYAEMDGRPLGLAPMTGGGTDAGFAARSGKPAVLESFGLAGFGYHARDEYIEIDSIVPRLYLVARMLEDLGSGMVFAK